MCGNGETESQPPVLVSTEQNNQNPSKSTNEQSYKDKYETESLKAKLKEIISQDQNQNIKTTGKQKHHWYDTFIDHTTDWLLVLFNFLLVVVTILLVLYNSRLWKETEKLWKASQDQSTSMNESINQAVRSATAMEKVARSAAISAQVAIENVEIFKDVREKQLRPWVLADSIYINNVINPSKIDKMKIPGYKPTGAQIIDTKIGPIATVYIKNSGPTPAINLTHWAIISIQEYPLRSDLPEKRSDVAITKATIPSQGFITLAVHYPDPITTEQIDALKNGTMVIYVHGEIVYTDIFSKNRKTSYRVMHGVMSGLLGINTTVTICEEGNEID